MDKQLESQYYEDEYSRGTLPYKLYFQALESVLDFSIVESFADFGCNNGGVMHYMKEKFPHVTVAWVDYFEWAKKHAHPSIKENITIADLAEKFDIGRQYDIVNSTEVGEHIEKSWEQNFIDNITRAASDMLILTWSAEESHGNDQHQNPRWQTYIIEEVEKRGFTYSSAMSKDLADALQSSLLNMGYNWWAHDIMIFRRLKFPTIDGQYWIAWTETNNILNVQYFKRASWCKKESFQSNFLRLTRLIKEKSLFRENLNILRFGDGDYYFLRENPIGSAKPGNRALTKPYKDIDMTQYRDLFWNNEIISVEDHSMTKIRSLAVYYFFTLVSLFIGIRTYRPKTEKSTKIMKFIGDKFLAVFTSRIFLFPILKAISYFKGNIFLTRFRQIPQFYLESVYALVSSRWIFRNYPDSICLVGGAQKIRLIRELMKHEEYRQYLWVNTIDTYIEIPEKWAANDPEKVAQEVGEQLIHSKAKIVLVGVGSVKYVLMPLMKQYVSCPIIDVGCGLDALAWVVSQDRPYFAKWVNYRIEGYDYSKIDFMDKNNPERHNPIYSTVVLKK